MNIAIGVAAAVLLVGCGTADQQASNGGRADDSGFIEPNLVSWTTADLPTRRMVASR